MPAGLVKAPSNNGSPSILRSFTTRDARNRIDPAEREFLTRRFQADLAHLVGQPVPGYSIDVRSGAMESLLFVGVNNRANALLHTPLQFAYRDVNPGRDHSTLMLAARITLAHFSVSSRMSLPKSSGEPGSTMPPRSANRAFNLGIGKRRH